MNKLVALTLIIVLYSSGYTFSQQSNRPPEPWLINLNQIVNQLLSSRSETQWLLNRDFPLDPPLQELDYAVNLAGRLTRDLNGAIEKNSQIPQVKVLGQAYGGKIFVTYFSSHFGGTTRLFSKGPPPSAPSRKLVEVTFYANQHQSHPRINNRLLFYHKNTANSQNDWRGVFMGGINYQEFIWFDAWFLHELWHAHLDRQGHPSASAPFFSDAWSEGELQAHDLEEAVLAFRTKGKYLAEIERIVAEKKATKVEVLLERVSLADIESLEHLFRRATKREIGLRAAQHFTSLCSYWLNANVPKQASRQARKEVYQRVLKGFQTIQ